MFAMWTTPPHFRNPPGSFADGKIFQFVVENGPKKIHNPTEKVKNSALSSLSKEVDITVAVLQKTA